MNPTLMQTTFTSTIIENQTNFIEIIQQLDKVTVLHSKLQKKLYAEIVKYYKRNNVNKLPNSKINELKSSYQLKFNINARQFNSIFAELSGKISSVLELNNGYLEDTKDNVSALIKAIKPKQKILDSLNKSMSGKNYTPNHIDKVNHQSLTKKLYYLNQRLNKANKKLAKLTDIAKSGNPHLCFGSKKLFNQQFQINTQNNLTEFKSHADWKKAWTQSRNKSFFLLGSSDETQGNQNCQIKHIENNIYELKVNINPKEPKLKERYITFQIKLHNDKNNLIKNILENGLSQALTYRFYRDYKNNTYSVFISLDKSKQQPKVISSKLLGTVGIDINADHLAVTEVDRFGNLNKAFNLPIDLKDKTTEQSLDIIACAVKEITDYAVTVNKPIVIEKLDFTQKKKQLRDSYNKKYNVMLSSLVYSKIKELIQSRSFDKGIEVIEVNPAYTSKIGKFKYQNKYKLTTHQAAAFVIARRGLLSYNKVVKIKNKDNILVDKLITIVNKEKTISIRCSKYYPFGLPARNNQKQDNIYWKEVEQNYLKVKMNRILIKKKRRKLILAKQDLASEISLVADNFGVYRGSNPNLLF